ncbi:MULTISPECIES: LacI family DNA-binding transcriptional regulator [unclassified Ruegeria]|uniref:LacI family DNA-binding transcriptional regulator n=1 Tax=unclassified Ruegeria TaxID=2625375 RepID=UPI001487C2BA|nr:MULTISPECIES: LacI family DNA-binding transcriptional regulator [unclassified Ruegeria]NOD34566.1 substrate-binding domain-containing protein [Ruegeria sp. HKCCD7296]NOD47679.1 substrate-binding domain-containing protein [Ruegeria sp. HKCCD5849]NOD52658.1 substrate-binding domain-containing protein [Ruegeria sp. HKCCD5851]NOD66077.1 substrate-binding domain-containing protein [Ruegeria sp. HKCCD7303]NOE35730.1 substrate-binding domain-containing protein [Ruegeria sp. HKCCD7318]
MQKASEPKKRANLRDVAKAAGVSVATVSRVLNEPGLVKKDTLEKVQAAIATLKFVPSAAARAINSGRTRFVGALIPTLDNAIFARFLAALERKLSEHQLSLVVATTDSNPDTEAEKAKSLIDIGAEGLIVTGATHCAAMHDLLERTMIPTIITSFYESDNALPTIGYDNAAAAQLALHHLAELGHKDIAVVHGPVRDNDRTRARLDGLKTYVFDGKLTTFETQISHQGGANVADHICSLPRLPDAILCLSDVVALGVLLGLQASKISVPEQVSMIGIDDLPTSAVTVPPLTSVHLPVSQMGERAADGLAQWITTQQAPHSEKLHARLIVRNSTRSLL